MKKEERRKMTVGVSTAKKIFFRLMNPFLFFDSRSGFRENAVFFERKGAPRNLRAAKRGDDFRPDPAVPTGSATPQDYTRSGYDRGHLAPAADMSFSVKTMSESFYMSNMSPQAPQFNRGIWSKLEKQVRHFATKEKRIVVVTGPILPVEKTITIGANKVTVPQYFITR